MHATIQAAATASDSTLGDGAVRRRPRGRLLLAAALLATVGVVGSAGIASARPLAGGQGGQAAVAAALGQRARVALPAPSGSHQVGTVSLHLVDTSRPDPWVATQPYRELMVSIRYPARDADRYPPAPQLTAGEAAAFPSQYVNGNGVPLDQVDWSATLTHAHQGAPVDRRGGPLPVVLYSPGAGDPSSLNSTLVDDLASRGYVVVTIDHTYEAPAVEFPGGRVATSVLAQQAAQVGDDPAKLTALLKKLVGVRVADTRFVLDQLDALAAGGNPDADHQQLPEGLAGALDPDRIGMFGQSGGGFTAAQAMHDDPRIKAAADLDGVLGYVGDDSDPANPATAATDGLDRPMLLMGSQGDDIHTNPSWGAMWDHSTGWHRDLTLCGSTETTFTDKESMLPQLARQLDLPPATVTKALGTIQPERAVAEQRAYLASFFDRWLRGRDNHLLDQPSAAHPDVRFVA
ncbi:alpha/beta hydrolase family protein [Kitasatospora kifunensis]|uniref:Dienelactone hydrolase n=1 Tax=Kitasatospora kifunensis TaxID=58351 RepID=A0A7W7QZR7_KITKI|nr:hydrolase [Kitasatospora kifunensis]MBB4922810.1 dienelactone hydrolase [Kitasatospora kifunensis]